MQEVLNGTEVTLQHLTALVDCRSLHLVRAGMGRGSGGWWDGQGWAGASAARGREPGLSLPALQDYVQALTGLCSDGVEGLIYLTLFSFVTALMFSSIVCSVPHTWPHKR